MHIPVLNYPHVFHVIIHLFSLLSLSLSSPLSPPLPLPFSYTVDDMGDERLMVAKELLRTEDTYLENLRNIFDIYMEPLK